MFPIYHFVHLILQATPNLLLIPTSLCTLIHYRICCKLQGKLGIVLYFRMAKQKNGELIGNGGLLFFAMFLEIEKKVLQAYIKNLISI